MDDEQWDEVEETGQGAQLKRRLGAIRKRQQARRQYFEYEIETLNMRLVQIKEREKTRSGERRDS